MKHKFNSLIIGSGQIGALFDNPKSNNIISHAHGYNSHDGFKLVGFVDTNNENAKEAAKLWETNVYKTIDEAFAQ